MRRPDAGAYGTSGRNRAAMTAQWLSGPHAKNLARLFVGSWFSIALSLSVTGWFERFDASTLFGVGTVITVTAFTVLYKLETRFRKIVRPRDLRRLTYGQALRFYGILAFFKEHQHILPAVFAIPTGVLDVAFAGSSFYVASRFAAVRGRPSPMFFAWHIAGLGALATSIILVYLTESTRFGLVEGDITSQSMAWFPMSLVPTFIGPMVLVFHLLAICDGRREAASAEGK